VENQEFETKPASDLLFDSAEETSPILTNFPPIAFTYTDPSAPFTSTVPDIPTTTMAALPSVPETTATPGAPAEAAHTTPQAAAAATPSTTTGNTNDFQLVGSGLLSVKDSLELCKPSAGLLSLLKSSEGSWMDFGKKNSHILRTKLFKLFAMEKMSKDAIFMIYFFHAAVKDCVRIRDALETLSNDMRAATWMNEVDKFLQKRMVKLVVNEKAHTFASVHLPNTNPGLDILCYLMQQKAPTTAEGFDELVKGVISRTTFAQMDINLDLQDENKKMIKFFWDSIVLLKDKEDRIKNKQPIGFQENFYTTQASDQYKFVLITMKEWDVGTISKVDLRNYVAHTMGLTMGADNKVVFST
jgi:hypothetical protein